MRDAALFCYEHPGGARPIFSNRIKPRKMKRRGQILTSCGVGSLVINSLCDQAMGQNAAVV